MWPTAATLEFDDIENKAVNGAFKRIRIAVMRKVRLDCAMPKDHARRAAFDQKVRHRVQTNGAGVNC